MNTSGRLKLCKICGGTATCFNFNVLACESCKSFFRRSGHLTIDDFRCAFDDDCVITYDNRKCKKCRLKKCFQSGMELPFHHANMVQKHRKDRLKASNEEALKAEIIDAGLYQIRNAAIDYFAHNAELVSWEQQQYQKDKLFFPNCIHLLSKEDRTSIYELWEASTLLIICDDDIRRLEKSGNHPTSDGRISIDTAAFLLEECHKKLIEMVKELSFFAELCEQDQISLIKGAIGEIYIIFQVQTYDRDTETIRCAPYNPTLPWFIKIDEVTNLHNDLKSIYLQRFILTYDPDWQKDRTLNLILMAIALYTVRLEHPLIEQEAIEKQFQKYKDLLKRYLSTQYKSKAKADFTTESLMVKLLEMRSFQHQPQECILRSARQMILPLLYELFGGETSQAALIAPVANDV